MRRQAVSFLCHFPSAFAAWGFPSALALRCPDFPRTACAARGHPACLFSVALLRGTFLAALRSEGRMPRWPTILAMLVVSATGAACGGTLPDAGSEASPPAAGAPTGETGFAAETSAFSETGGTEPADTTATSEPPAPELKPPPIVLKSEAGRQEAVVGSYCITSVS